MLGGVRTLIRHPMRAWGAILGHKMEVQYGDFTKRKHNPPKIPKHPLQDVGQNMNEIITYADLKIRWQHALRFPVRCLKISRKWKCKRNIHPTPKPTCSFVWHNQMPHRTAMPEMPSREDFAKIRDTKDVFAVFKSSILHQNKVAVGDLVQCEKLHRREAGEQIVFGTVFLVGSRDWTIIGKPTVPYARIKATIEQQTLAGEMITFHYKPRRNQQRFMRRRQYITMVRIDEIVVDPEMDAIDSPPPKADRLLDLWANRWLDPVEKEGIEMVEGPQGPEPKVAALYDGSEHQPGSYHRRGLVSCYRFWPDPQYTHWGPVLSE